LPVEIFKLLGAIAAAYLSLHYYTVLSDSLRKGLNLKFIPLEFLDFLIFVVLALVGYCTFVILRELFGRLIKMEAAPNLAKWGGLFLGICRGFLLTGLLTFILFISSVSYLKESVITSYAGKRLLNFAPAVYSGIWQGVGSKFMPGEKFNQTVLEVQENLKQ